ncbi:MAG: efflux RND transporter periplasmic adaptor subunit [Poseidonibacter sp.]|uniref:efflux RND transporter periplasmic adaptor subunit n=1 Tax=Poseidonibacter sp. TaxID=2321188 RepID=UPI00359DB571
MIIEQNKDSSASELINNLRLIRYSNINQYDRMEHYTQNIYYLLKANELILFEKKDNSWASLINISQNNEVPIELKDSAFELASKAYDRGFSYEQIRYPINNLQNQIAVAFKLETDDDRSLIVFFTITFINQSELNNTVLKTQLINDVLKTHTSQTNQEPNNSISANEDIQYILNLSTELLEIKKFKVLANTLVNNISVKFEFDKVSLGMYKNNKLELVSISHIDEFEKTHVINESLLELFDESVSQNEDIVLIDCDDSELVNITHRKYYAENNIKTLITFPLRFKEKIIGAITLHSHKKIFTENEVLLLRLTINKVSAIINNLYETDISLPLYLLKKAKSYLKYWLSPKASFVKIIVTILSLIMFYMMFFTWKYEVDATSVLVTDKEAYITSPFMGIIDEVFVQSGDKVNINQKLFSLNVDELKIKEMESRADIIRYQKEQNKFMAQRELADMSISKAKVTQAISRLERIKYTIENSIIKSPINGIIVQGDREKLIGSPINKGDLIFQISNSNELYLEIKIPEKDIYNTSIGQKGELILLSEPLNSYAFTISKIIPKAEVNSQDGNVYIAYGLLDTKQEDWWHPGMSGIVKIDTGEKNIFWILTHNLFDSLRIFLW